MFLIPQIENCQNCRSLKELISEIECSLYNLITNKWNNDRFNTDNYFSLEHFDALTHYKRIVTHRIFNTSYTGIEAQDIISQVERLLYGELECTKCHDCDKRPFFDTTTTTTSSTTSSSTTGTSTTSSTTSTSTTNLVSPCTQYTITLDGDTDVFWTDCKSGLPSQQFFTLGESPVVLCSLTDPTGSFPSMTNDGQCP